MDILDILLDILLKPPQPFKGLFLTKRYIFIAQDFLQEIQSDCQSICATVCLFDY